MERNTQGFLIAALAGCALVGFSGCERDKTRGTLHEIEEKREQSGEPAARAPSEGAQNVGAGRTQPVSPALGENEEASEKEKVSGRDDISGQNYGAEDDRQSARDDLGTTRTPRGRGTYNVIETGGQTGGAGAGGAGPATAGGGPGGANTGGAAGGGINAGTTGGTGGLNTGGTGGMNTGATTGGTGGTTTGGTGGGNTGINTGGGNTAGTGGGIRGGADAGSRLGNPDSLGTGRKYPDDSL